MDLIRDILGFLLIVLVVGYAIAKDGEDIVRIKLEDGSVSNAPPRPKGKQIVKPTVDREALREKAARRREEAGR